MRIAIVALGLVCAPAAAQAQNQDVRCLVAANVFVNTEKDAAKRQIASAARMFYLGRVDARLSGAPLAQALAAESKGMTEATIGTVMTDCAKALQGKLAALSALTRQR